MTRYGIVLQLYSEYVTPRPFSRFTTVWRERHANAAWAMDAHKWAATRVDAYGNYTGVQ